MNSQLQTALDIKSRINNSNPFILHLPVNSISQQHLNLSTSAHLLKKLSLIDISQSKELAHLFKESLLDVIQNPLLELKSHQTIEEIVYFLDYWQASMGKMASWPHTRTCFYYLEEKLKKHKYFDSLDFVRLKRAQLEPNKKDFLNQIMAEPVHSKELQNYINELKQMVDDISHNSLSLNSNLQAFKSQENFASKKIISEIQQEQKPQLNTNILYSDSIQDWKQVSSIIQQIKDLQKLNNHEGASKLKDQVNTLLQTYILEKIPVYVRWMKSKNYSKEKILQELNFRRSIVMNFGVKERTQILNLTISRLTYNGGF